MKHKNKRIELGIFIAMMVVLGGVVGYNQSIMVTCWDNAPHINLARVLFEDNPDSILHGAYYPMQAKAYPLFHFCVRILAEVFWGDYNTAGIFVLVGMSLLAVLMYKFMLDRLVQPDTLIKGLIIDFISIFSIVFETIPGPLTDGRFYMSQCSANPWHNPTIIMVRPLGILAFWFFVSTFKKMKVNQNYAKDIILFSVFSFISVLAKPSYAVVLLPAAGVVTLLYFGGDYRKRMTHAISMFVSVLPSLGMILFQFMVSEKTAVPVAFQFGSFSGFTVWQMIKVCIATFPIPLLTILICEKKELFADEYCKLAFFTLFFGWFEMFFFTNGGSGDFSWGYDLSVSLCTIICMYYVIKNFGKGWRTYIIMAIFLMQSVSGIIYLIKICQRGGNFWF